MIGAKTFVLLCVLAATAGVIAGTALGVGLAVTTDRARSLFEPIDWEGVDD